MKIKGFLLSIWFYYFLTAVVLVILNVVVFPYLIQGQVISRDFGDNLISEFWGILATLVLLIVIFEIREQLVKKSLKERLFERIGRQLYLVFNIIRKFVVTKRHSVRLSRQEFLDELKEQSSKESLILDDYAWNYLPKPADRLYGLELESLFRSRSVLGDLEVKYLEFLEPELRLSLMEIQHSLDALKSTVHFMREMEVDLEVLSKSISKDIHCIMKEIYKIHAKTGIEIFPSTSK